MRTEYSFNPHGVSVARALLEHEHGEHGTQAADTLHTDALEIHRRGQVVEPIPPIPTTPPVGMPAHVADHVMSTYTEDTLTGRLSLHELPHVHQAVYTPGE